MNNARLLQNTLIRLKNLALQFNDDEEFEEYCYRFKKIMETLDENDLSIPRRLEDLLFDAGLPDGTNSRYYRTPHINDYLKGDSTVSSTRLDKLVSPNSFRRPRNVEKEFHIDKRDENNYRRERIRSPKRRSSNLIGSDRSSSESRSNSRRGENGYRTSSDFRSRDRSPLKYSDVKRRMNGDRPPEFRSRDRSRNRSRDRSRDRSSLKFKIDKEREDDDILSGEFEIDRKVENGYRLSPEIKIERKRITRSLSPMERRNLKRSYDDYSTKYNSDDEMRLIKRSRRDKSQPEKVDFLEYHKANAHSSLEILKLKAKKENFEIENVRECNVCTNHSVMAKFLESPQPKGTATKIGEKIHCFLSPNFVTPSYHGSRLYLMAIDEYSKMIFVYTLEDRSEIQKVLVKFLVHCMRFTGETVKLITKDLPELRRESLQKFFYRRFVDHEIIEDDKKDEFVDYYAKYIQVILKLTMCDAEGLEESLWSEGIKAAVYVFNNLPNLSLDGETPSEVWKDRQLVCTDEFYPFGTWFMASFIQNRRQRSCLSRFIGYHPHEKYTFRFYNPKDKSVSFGRIKSKLATQPKWYNNQ